MESRGIRFLLSVTDIFSKTHGFVPSKDKQSITIANAFQKVLIKSGCKPNKIWIDKGSQFIIDQLNHGCKIMI